MQRFTRKCICNNVSDFNGRNLVITYFIFYTFTNYVKLSQNFIKSDQKGYFPFMFYEDVIKKFKSDTSQLVKSLKILFVKAMTYQFFNLFFETVVRYISI